MMYRAWLEIELLEDCVFSAQAATEGGHASLDRIPGAALLGAAAARCYRTLGKNAFMAFHSGRMRFGDGLPVAPSGATAWPVPMAWHHPKNARLQNEQGYFDSDQLHNFIHDNHMPPKNGRPVQPKQLRQGYVTVHGEWVRPRRDLRLKTAIQATTGRAAEGQLFGYDALHRGQRFRALLEADDEVGADLFRQVLDSFDRKETLLGRSRSAEYGLTRIEVVEPSESTQPPLAGEPSTDGILTLWLLSDLALTDEHGQPTCQPRPSHFGLPDGEILWEKTFLRWRRYSPWNAHRGGFDRERLVLQAGGVISLRPPQGYDRQALIERLDRGLGLYREAGLGRLWLDPPLLADQHPNFENSASRQAESSPVEAKAPEHPLVGWLQDQGGGWKLASEEAAEQFVKDYFQVIDKARRFGGIPPEAVYGPSRSQWGQVLAKARATKGDELYQALFEGDDAIIKDKAEGWHIEIDGRRRLAEWLKERLHKNRLLPVNDIQKEDADRSYAHCVRTSARRIQDKIRRRRV